MPIEVKDINVKGIFLDILLIWSCFPRTIGGVGWGIGAILMMDLNFQSGDGT